MSVVVFPSCGYSLKSIVIFPQKNLVKMFRFKFHFETCVVKYLHTFWVSSQFVFTPPIFIYV
jgi:hypothetical protein